MAATPSQARPDTVDLAEPSVSGHRPHTRIGLLGTAMISLGGIGTAATLQFDPLLSNTVFGLWRYGHGKMLAAAMLYIGYALLVLAWVRLGQAVRAKHVDAPGVLQAIWIWCLPLLVAPPLFTRDPYIYLAQGAVANAGFDPYTTGPSALDGPVTDNVSSLWLSTPSPYGPLFILLIKSIVAVTGANVLVGVLLTRLVLITGFVIMCASLPGLCRHLGGRPATALWLAAANPLVLVHLIGGAHNDVLMVGLLCAGTLFVLNRSYVLGFALIAAAMAVKVTAGVVLPFLVWVWVARRPRSTPVKSFVFAAGIGAGIVVAVFGVFTLLAGVDLGWLGALDGNKVVDLWLSVPTAFGRIVAMLIGVFADIDGTVVVEIARLGGWAALATVVVWLWWRSRAGGAVAIQGAALALLATVLLSSVTFPWYFSWPLALAAVFALPAAGTAVIGGLSVWMVLSTFPDGQTAIENWWFVLLTAAVSVYAGMQLRART